jgi:primosomal protein N' (replication factor Y)
VSTSRRAAEHEPIARVLPMLSVPHLDREFDYLVAADQSDDAQPGVRARVRFHGRLVDAFVLERRSDTDHVGELGWLDRVMSPEPVLTPDVRRLVDAVAARYAGTRADVLRLAMPPRHARVEREVRAAQIPSAPAPVDVTNWGVYQRGERFVAALAEGRAARAVWQALPPAWPKPWRWSSAPGAARWPWCPTSATSTLCSRTPCGSSTLPRWSRCPRVWGRPNGTAAGWPPCAATRAW